MGEDVKNEDAFGPVVDTRDQPIVVAVNIEHGSSPHDVGMREVAPRFRQRAPIRSLGDTVPGLEVRRVAPQLVLLERPGGCGFRL